MSSTTDYRGLGDEDAYSAPVGAGWVAFAGCMLGLAGTWNVISGFLAIGRSHVYGPTAEFLFSDLKTWGWILVVAGILQILAAFGIASGSEWARWFGIAIAGLNSIVQLSFVPAQPWWSISMFAVDLLVIYGLAAYGGRRMREA